MHTSRIVRSLEKKGLLTLMVLNEKIRAEVTWTSPQREKRFVIKGLASVDQVAQAFFKPIKGKGERVYRFDEDPYPGNDIPMERNKRP